MNPGDRIGHYRLETRLGSGGMGVVYRANRTVRLSSSQAHNRHPLEYPGATARHTSPDLGAWRCAPGKGQPVIIIKKKSHGHQAHHGGAWKVAYADFVTAMMAANAAAVTQMQLRNLPGGEYEVTVLLVDVNGNRMKDRRLVLVMAALSDY